MKKEYTAKNLKYLRERFLSDDSFKMTQKRFSKLLCMAQNTYSQYESGSRPIPNTFIEEISEVCRLDVQILKYTDLEQYPERLAIPSILDIKDIINKILPIFSSVEAMNNENFLYAYNFVKNIEKAVYESSVVDIDELNKKYPVDSLFECISKFELAWESDHIYLGLANVVIIILRVYTSLDPDNDRIMRFLLDENKRSALDIKKGFLIDKSNKDYFNKTIEYSKYRQEYISDFHDKVMKYIKILKSNSEYSDLADFLIANKYIVGLCDNSCSEHENNLIGMELMRLQQKLGNKYATKYPL